MPKEYHLLFVCTANICRSPMAEGFASILGQRLGISVQARSGGTMNLKGHPPASNAIKTMKKEGIDISNLRSSGVSANDVEWADYILTMEPKHAAKLREAFGEAEQKILILANFGGKMEIEDPVGKWIFRFHSTRKEIKKCILGFLSELAKREA